jgi:transposase
MMLVDLAALGLTDEQIAKRLGRNVRSVERKVATLREQGIRVKRPHVSKAARRGKRAYDMRVQGMRWRDISERLGLRAYGANSYAARYAAREGKPWPVKVAS